VDPLRTGHVNCAFPVFAEDVLGFESLYEGRKGRFEPDGGEGVVFDDLFIVDPQKLVRGRQCFEA